MDIDLLIERTVAGDVEAWQHLLAYVSPRVQQIAGEHAALRKRGLASADDISSVVTDALSRLAKDQFRNLSRYLQQHELPKPQSFESWLYGAVDFSVREHLRAKYGRAPRDVTSQARPSKRELNTQAERVDDDQLHRSVGKSLAMTERLQLAKIAEYIHSAFNAEELRAMRLHFAQDLGPAELAAALGLANAEAATKLIRRLNARLRHRFADRER